MSKRSETSCLESSSGRKDFDMNTNLAEANRPKIKFHIKIEVWPDFMTRQWRNLDHKKFSFTFVFRQIEIDLQLQASSHHLH